MVQRAFGGGFADAECCRDVVRDAGSGSVVTAFRLEVAQPVADEVRDGFRIREVDRAREPARDIRRPANVGS